MRTSTLLMPAGSSAHPEMRSVASTIASAAGASTEPIEGVVVVHDELDLPFGRLQLKLGGGTAGHNGLRSILASFGEEGFGRLRFVTHLDVDDAGIDRTIALLRAAHLNPHLAGPGYNPVRIPPEEAP